MYIITGMVECTRGRSRPRRA